METAWGEGLIDASSTYQPTKAPLWDGDTGGSGYTDTCRKEEERTSRWCVGRPFMCHVGVHIGECCWFRDVFPQNGYRNHSSVAGYGEMLFE